MTQNQPPSPGSSSLGELIGRISDSITGLVRSEIDLAKAKFKKMAATMAVGVGLLAVAGVLALYGLGFLLAGVAHAIALALPMWASLLIVALVLFILVGALAFAGAKQLEKTTHNPPTPATNLADDVDAATAAFNKGFSKGGQE